MIVDSMTKFITPDGIKHAYELKEAITPNDNVIKVVSNEIVSENVYTVRLEDIEIKCGADQGLWVEDGLSWSEYTIEEIYDSNINFSMSRECVAPIAETLRRIDFQTTGHFVRKEEAKVVKSLWESLGCGFYTEDHGLSYKYKVVAPDLLRRYITFDVDIEYDTLSDCLIKIDSISKGFTAPLHKIKFEFHHSQVLTDRYIALIT